MVEKPSWFDSKQIRRRFAAGLVILACCALAPAQQPAQKSFATPEEAAQALAEACAVNDVRRLSSILGPSARELLSSGDVISEKVNRKKFALAYEELNKLTAEGETRRILHVGQEEWPFPIPIVQHGNVWLFETLEGADELLRRRIAGNEAAAIKVCRLYVELQQQFAHGFHDNHSNGLYAQKFMSDPGKHNGLYWPHGGGGESSPASTLVELAAQEGYSRPDQSPKPFRGYFFRILTAQGPNAPGGSMNYFAGEDTGFFTEKLMNKGFALVAFPAKYQSSGVMTFIVNQDGIVYQKDVGEDSVAMGQQMREYDPDNSWSVAP